MIAETTPVKPQTLLAREQVHPRSTCFVSHLSCEYVNDSLFCQFLKDKPLLKLVFDPESPVTESDETNVLLSCNIVEANPQNLLEIEWFLNGTSLNIKETGEFRLK